MENKSEIARIRRQIELEYEAAARIFNQPSITSQHDFIEHRQEKLSDYFKELTQYMSPKEAIQNFMQIEKQGKKSSMSHSNISGCDGKHKKPGLSFSSSYRSCLGDGKEQGQSAGKAFYT
jgi:hypothetical protein